MIKKLAKEPLVYFAALGLLIYAFYIPGVSEEDLVDSTIELPQGFVADQRLKFEKQYGRLPTEQELDGLLDQAIDDEMLFREAWRLQLYVGDEVVRKRMIQKMRYILDEGSAAEGAQEELIDQRLAAIKENKKPAVHFSLYHLVFADVDDAKQHLLALSANDEAMVSNPRGVIAFPLGNVFASLSLDESKRLFGAAFSDNLRLDQDSQWQGPIQSRYGFHIVKLDNINEINLQDDADLRESIKQDIIRENQQQQRRKAIEDIRSRYDIALRD